MRPSTKSFESFKLKTNGAEEPLRTTAGSTGGAVASGREIRRKTGSDQIVGKRMQHDARGVATRNLVDGEVEGAGVGQRGARVARVGDEPAHARLVRMRAPHVLDLPRARS